MTTRTNIYIQSCTETCIRPVLDQNVSKKPEVNANLLMCLFTVHTVSGIMILHYTK